MAFDWSNVASAGVSALGSIFGGMASNAISVDQQKDLQRYQAALNYKYAKKSALNMPTFNRQGLENANFNPMLAISNGLSGANASWSTGGSATTSDLSGAVNNALNTALSVRQQNNQDKLANSQVAVNNADSVLKNNQAITEMYSQLEKLNHADLMQAQKMLTDKNVSWYDKQQAREDLRVANEIERTGNEFKIGMAQAIACQIGANAQMINSRANAQDVKNRYEIGKKANEIAEKNLPPKWAGTIGGIVGTGVGAGLGVYGAIRGGRKAPNFKTSVPYR